MSRREPGPLAPLSSRAALALSALGGTGVAAGCAWLRDSQASQVRFLAIGCLCVGLAFLAAWLIRGLGGYLSDPSDRSGRARTAQTRMNRAFTWGVCVNVTLVLLAFFSVIQPHAGGLALGLGLLLVGIYATEASMASCRGTLKLKSGSYLLAHWRPVVKVRACLRTLGRMPLASTMCSLFGEKEPRHVPSRFVVVASHLLLSSLIATSVLAAGLPVTSIGV